MEALNSVTLIEHNHLAEMHASLKRRLFESQRSDQSRMNSIRRSILGSVAHENYEYAKSELIGHVAHKTSYPDFQRRAERYVQHCCELIQAIETKRNFPGLAALALAKQQEIHEKVLEHFEELKQNLRMLEKIEREYRLADMRSTVWVLRAAVQCTVAIIAVAFIQDIEAGMFTTLIKVVNSTVDGISVWAVSLIGF